MPQAPFSPFRMQGFSSGTSALAAAILVAKKRHPHISEPRILLPAYTCPDLISAAVFCGVIPQLVDFEPGTHWMDLEQLQLQINKDTIAIIAINFLGIHERTEKIAELAGKNQLTFIEDSAQSLPSGDFDKTWHGDLVVLSFGRGKPLSLLSGGAVLFRDPEFDQTLKTIVENSAPETASWQTNWKFRLKVRIYNLLCHPLAYGLLSRLPGIKLGETRYHPLLQISAMPAGARQLFAENWKMYQSRKTLIEDYQLMFEQLGLPQLELLTDRCQHNPAIPLLRFPVLVKDPELRQRILQKLQQQGLGASAMYSRPLTEIESIPEGKLANDLTFPQAKQFADSLITLPVHEGIDTQILNRIGAVFTDVCEHSISSASSVIEKENA